MAKLGQGIVRQGMAEGVANLTALPKGMAKLGQGIVRHGMAEVVAIVTILPMVWQNWGSV